MEKIDNVSDDLENPETNTERNLDLYELISTLHSNEVFVSGHTSLLYGLIQDKR